MPSAPPFSPIHRGTLRQDLVGRILAAIFQSRFEDGDRLVVQRLAAQFQVSATPVREALVELAGIGLVTITPNCGAVVRPFGPRQLREIYQVRRVLEVEATRCACGRIDAAALGDLLHEFRELDARRDGHDWTDRSLDADVRFHALIAQHCGSTRLADEIARYNVLVQVGRQVVGNLRNAQELAVADHQAILRALQDGDSEAACEAMSRHLERTTEIVEASMFPPG